MWVEYQPEDHLLVSLQLLNKGALMEESLQPLLGIIVAELLEGGSPLALSHAWVLEAWRIHNQEGAQRVVTGFQRPGEYNTTHSTSVTSCKKILTQAEICTQRPHLRQP